MTASGFSAARRRLLQSLAGAGAALAVGSLARAADDAQILRVIPSSGERIPAIGLGTSRTFDIAGTGPRLDGAREVLRLFAAGGGRLVDSSPMYGHAESVIGTLARELALRQRLFYATKVWTHGRQQGVRQMLASLDRMGTARMDLMQVHNLVDTEVHLETLHSWKQQRMLRYIGITHYQQSAFEALERVMRRGGLDFVQFNFSLAEPAAEQRLLPLAADLGIAVIVNRPFARGALFGRVRGKPLPEWAGEFGATSWAQFFLKFILGHPAVSCVIPATGKPKHLLDNLGAGRGALPDARTRRRMAALIDELK